MTQWVFDSCWNLKLVLRLVKLKKLVVITISLPFKHFGIAHGNDLQCNNWRLILDCSTCSGSTCKIVNALVHLVQYFGQNNKMWMPGFQLPTWTYWFMKHRSSLLNTYALQLIVFGVYLRETLVTLMTLFSPWAQANLTNKNTPPTGQGGWRRTLAPTRAWKTWRNWLANLPTSRKPSAFSREI